MENARMRLIMSPLVLMLGFALAELRLEDERVGRGDALAGGKAGRHFDQRCILAAGVILRASKPSAVRTKTTRSPLIVCSAVLGTMIAAASRGRNFSRHEGARPPDASWVVDGGDHACERVSLSSSGLTKMIAGRPAPPAVTMICCPSRTVGRSDGGRRGRPRPH